MIVEIIDEQNQLPTDIKIIIIDIFTDIKKRENLPEEVEVTLSIVNDETIQQLNEQYREKNIPTDVLSFPLYEKEEIENLPRDLPISLGDIVISYDRGKDQAEQFGHSVKREITFLAIHGLLHLLGFDHDTEENEKIMFAYQNKMLEEYGFER